MKCPFCSNTKSKVTDKRESSDEIRRRRECLRCEKRFTTYERRAEQDIYVIKKDNSRQKFDRQKLERGLQKAFEKRPVSQGKIKEIANDIEEQIRKKGKKEIKSSTIGEIVMKKLKKTDKVAYVRFASVYRDFKDINDFKKEIREL
jgi:transcriptional repressor NrdR